MEIHDLSATPRGRDFVEEATKAKARSFGDRLDDEIPGGSLALGREQLEALTGLGHVSVGAPSQRAFRRTDLRPFASALSKLQSARDLLSARRFPVALAGYDSLLAACPESPLARQERAQALRSMGRLDDTGQAEAELNP